MKKALYVFSGIIFLAFISFSQSIRVTKPVNGEVWDKSSANTIEWVFSGEVNEFVKIRLYNIHGTILIKNITDSSNTLTTNRSYTCPPNFFNDVADGDYKVRVKIIGQTILSDSLPFSIGRPPNVVIDNTVDVAGQDNEPEKTPIPRLLPPKHNIPGLKNNSVVLPSSIKINYPNSGTNWKLKLGNTSLPFPIRVQWEKTGPGTQDRRVKIFLFRKVVDQYMRKKILLTPSTPNSGLYTGEISRNLRSSMYSIIIQTLDGKIRVESQTFLITNAENDPH